MGEKFLVEKIKELCLEGDNFSKGYHKVVGNLKLRYYGGKNSERVRVIEGQEKVGDYVKLKKFERYEFNGENDWERIVEKEYLKLK